MARSRNSPFRKASDATGENPGQAPDCSRLLYICTKLKRRESGREPPYHTLIIERAGDAGRNDGTSYRPAVVALKNPDGPTLYSLPGVLAGVRTLYGVTMRLARIAACGLRPRRAYRPCRRCGRVAEGGGLLNRYRVVKPYRGFESLRLRHLRPVRFRRRPQ